MSPQYYCINQGVKTQNYWGGHAFPLPECLDWQLFGYFGGRLFGLHFHLQHFNARYVRGYFPPLPRFGHPDFNIVKDIIQKATLRNKGSCTRASIFERFHKRFCLFHSFDNQTVERKDISNIISAVYRKLTMFLLFLHEKTTRVRSKTIYYILYRYCHLVGKDFTGEFISLVFNHFSSISIACFVVFSCPGHEQMVSSNRHYWQWDEHHYWFWVRLNWKNGTTGEI